VTWPGGAIFQASSAAKSDIWGIGNAGGTGNALLHFGGRAWRRVRPAALAGFAFTRARALAVQRLGSRPGRGPPEARSF
jgi:hypothetical protein